MLQHQQSSFEVEKGEVEIQKLVGKDQVRNMYKKLLEKIIHLIQEKYSAVRGFWPPERHRPMYA